MIAVVKIRLSLVIRFALSKPRMHLRKIGEISGVSESVGAHEYVHTGSGG